MFIEVTEKEYNEKVTINVNTISYIFPFNDGTRIYLTNGLPRIDIKERYEDVKRCLEIVMKQMSKRTLIS